MDNELMQYVRSYVDGRLRLRHPALKGIDDNSVTMLRDMVMSIDGMVSLEVNPTIGSLLLVWDKYQLTREDIEGYLTFWASMLETDDEPQEAADKAVLSEVTGDVQCLCQKGFDHLARVIAPNAGSVGRTRRVAQNRIMLGLGAGSIAALAFNYRVHAGLGWAFLAMLALHLCQHRRVL